jgi:hypothetical protein
MLIQWVILGFKIIDICDVSYLVGMECCIYMCLGEFVKSVLASLITH